MSAIVQARSRTADGTGTRATPPRWRTALGWVLIASSGVVAAAALPRGPVTGRQLAGLVVALFLVGAAVGWLLPRRSVVAAWTLAGAAVVWLRRDALTGR